MLQSDGASTGAGGDVAAAYAFTAAHMDTPVPGQPTIRNAVDMSGKYGGETACAMNWAACTGLGRPSKIAGVGQSRLKLFAGFASEPLHMAPVLLEPEVCVPLGCPPMFPMQATRTT